MKSTIRKIRALYYRMIYKNPTKHMHVYGVTGTDGKSTTCEMLYQILKASGKSAGIISTIGGKINDIAFDTGLHTSTPSSKYVYETLKRMKDAGVTHCVLELTSHGLHQHRAYGITLDACAYTNITPEHLDYHKTFEAYRSAKALMMQMVKEGGVVALNRNDTNYKFLTDYAKKLHKNLHIVYYETHAEHEPVVSHKNTKHEKNYDAHDIHMFDNHSEFIVKLSNLKFPLRLGMPGIYNVQNALAAMSLAVSTNLPLQGIVKGIEHMQSLKGRMNVLQEKPYKVIVDFAHTPNAYLQVLPVLKSETQGNLIVLFGCPGKRDTLKRLPMGKTASDYADIIILTSEDPRDEPFDHIIKDITKGIDTEKFQQEKNLFIIPDREKAIAFVLQSLAKTGDTVAFLGKGHEQSNCIGDVEYPWDETKVALTYLKHI